MLSISIAFSASGTPAVALRHRVDLDRVLPVRVLCTTINSTVLENPVHHTKFKFNYTISVHEGMIAKYKPGFYF